MRDDTREGDDAVDDYEYIGDSVDASGGNDMAMIFMIMTIMMIVSVLILVLRMIMTMVIVHIYSIDINTIDIDHPVVDDNINYIILIMAVLVLN